MSAIASHILQSTIFALAAALLTLFLRNNHARTRYWIWLTASLKFLIPFSIFIELGHRLSWTKATTVIAQQPTVAIAIDTISQPFEPASVPIPATTPATTLPILPIIWICGSAIVLIYWLIRWHRIAAMRRTSDPRLEPGVFGIFRPVLYLPPGIADHLDDAQLKAIVAHELCHIERRDNLTAALHMLVEAAFWFHPLVWWIGARLVDERERACDEAVIRDGSDPEVYAESILKICKLYLESPLPCVSGISGSDLKQRIAAIMSNRKLLSLSPAKKIALALAASVALAVPVLVGIVHAQSNTPKYEVASVRPSHDCPSGFAVPLPAGMSAMPKGAPPPPPPLPRNPAITSIGRLSECHTLADLIHMAYVTYADGHYHPVWGPVLDAGPPLEGGPAWVRSDGYRIDATAPGAGVETLRGPVLQAILEERFHLKVTHTTKDIPVYALTVAKGGAKLQPPQIDCFLSQPEGPPQTPKPGQSSCRDMIGGMSSPMTLQMQAGTIERMAQMLDRLLDRPVIDRTGITGKFDIKIEFSLDDSMRKNPQPAAASDQSAGPPLIGVLEKQLGLKLEATKGPSESLVIDHVERPSEN